MRVVISGAGAVGRHLASDLANRGHSVTLIEQDPAVLEIAREWAPQVDHFIGDACEPWVLEKAQLNTADVVVASTGDDEDNLVTALLAKQEFGVPRVLARVNHPDNEWLFTDQWGVDVSVSKPRLMAALVEEAVTVGDLVRLMTFRQSQANLVEITLPEEAPYVGHAVREIPLPRDSALVAILRGKRVVAPTPADSLEPGDELVFVCTSEVEEDVRRVILGERALP